MIKGLHHNVYRCRDSEETRSFYEEFLGLPLAGTLEIKETKSGRKTKTLHTFYELDEGEYLAFFEAPGVPLPAKSTHPAYDIFNHIALQAADRAEVMDYGPTVLDLETTFLVPATSTVPFGCAPSRTVRTALARASSLSTKPAYSVFGVR